MWFWDYVFCFVWFCFILFLLLTFPVFQLGLFFFLPKKKNLLSLAVTLRDVVSAELQGNVIGITLID